MTLLVMCKLWWCEKSDSVSLGGFVVFIMNSLPDYVGLSLGNCQISGSMSTLYNVSPVQQLVDRGKYVGAFQLR